MSPHNPSNYAIPGRIWNLDYSGYRKTHCFPPPYGLGSHSLTHRPTENPTGGTKKKLGLCCLGLQKYAGAIYCTLQFYKGLFHLF